MKQLLLFLPLLIVIGLGFFLWKGLYLNPKELPSALIDKPVPQFELPWLEKPGQTWAWRTDRSVERIALAVIAGGALGNIIDRWRQGAVTDFLDFHWAGWHWPTFNGADIFICMGAIFLLLSGLGGDKPAGHVGDINR